VRIVRQVRELPLSGYLRHVVNETDLHLNETARGDQCVGQALGSYITPQKADRRGVSVSGRLQFGQYEGGNGIPGHSVVSSESTVKQAGLARAGAWGVARDASRQHDNWVADRIEF
jgi:hypothetical protein